MYNCVKESVTFQCCVEEDETVSWGDQIEKLRNLPFLQYPGRDGWVNCQGWRKELQYLSFEMVREWTKQLSMWADREGRDVK